MSVRRGPIDLGDDDVRRIIATTGRELRETRLALGLSQTAVARLAGVSASRLGRLERIEARDPSLSAMARVARVLGLTLSVRLVPAGSPVRDAGQQRVLDRFLMVPAFPLRVTREPGLPIAGDLRAWDAAIVAGSEMAFVDCESRLGDVQALERRLTLKLRDDARSRTLILVVGKTHHNERVLRLERESLRALLPLDGPAVGRALRAGRIPPASGLTLV